MKDAVANISPVTLFPLGLVNGSFTTDAWAINNNYSVTIELSSMLSSGFAATAKIQGSLGDNVWNDLCSMQASISGDDQILWSMTELDSIMYLRIDVTVSSGSSIISIRGRAI